MNKKYVIAITTVAVVLGSVGGYLLIDSPNNNANASQTSEIQTKDPESNDATPATEVAPIEETTPSGTQPVTQGNNTAPTTPVSSPSQEPAVTPSPEPAVAPEPAPVTIVTAEKVSVGGEDYDCSLTYSDGTALIKQFIRVTYNQGYRTIATIGKCDSSLIGKNKVI